MCFARELLTPLQVSTIVGLRSCYSYLKGLSAT